MSADVAALGLFNSVRCAEIASRRCNYRLGQPVSMRSQHVYVRKCTSDGGIKVVCNSEGGGD